MLRAFRGETTNTRVGESWLDTAKIARKAGHTQTAYSAILQAEHYGAIMSFFESAKLTKATGEAKDALQQLCNALEPAVAKIYSLDAARRVTSMPLAKVRAPYI